MKPELLKDRIESIGGIDQVNAMQDIVCILSIDERIKNQVGTSFIGRMSNHWSEDFTKNALGFDEKLEQNLNILLDFGWEKEKNRTLVYNVLRNEYEIYVFSIYHIFDLIFIMLLYQFTKKNIIT